MSPALRDILSKYGSMPGFSTCDCANCYATREVERRATTRQAFHTVMGANLFENIAADMGVHWAFVALWASSPKDGPALRALKAISDANIELTYEPLPAAPPGQETGDAG